MDINPTAVRVTRNPVGAIPVFSTIKHDPFSSPLKIPAVCCAIAIPLPGCGVDPVNRELRVRSGDDDPIR